MIPAGSLSLKQSLIKPRRALLKYTIHKNSTHPPKPWQFHWWIKEARLHNTWPAGRLRVGLCMLIGFASGPAALCSPWRQLSISGWVMEAHIERNGVCACVCVCMGGNNAVSRTNLSKKKSNSSNISQDVNKMQFPNGIVRFCWVLFLLPAACGSRRLMTSARSKPEQVRRAWSYFSGPYRLRDCAGFWWCRPDLSTLQKYPLMHVFVLSVFSAF